VQAYLGKKPGTLKLPGQIDDRHLQAIACLRVQSAIGTRIQWAVSNVMSCRRQTFPFAWPRRGYVWRHETCPEVALSVSGIAELLFSQLILAVAGLSWIVCNPDQGRRNWIDLHSPSRKYGVGQSIAIGE
jgi:hypothetical protein